jgi:glutaredoxin
MGCRLAVGTIDMSKLIIYTIPGCGTCARAVKELTNEGAVFEERNIQTNDEWYEEAARLSISVPVVIRDGKVEIGWKGDLGCPFQ